MLHRSTTPPGQSADPSGATLRIATLYVPGPPTGFETCDMSTIRWLRMSESLARLGFDVDMIVNHGGRGTVERAPGFRLVPPADFDWRRYDVIKTLFHRGFQMLANYGGDAHPFIVSKLGSVVGSDDGTDGVHFVGDQRRWLYEIQRRIAAVSRYVTVLTPQSRALWQQQSGRIDNVLLVPTGVDRRLPPPRVNPYAGFEERIAVYVGNLYEGTQQHVNRAWQERLNAIGRALRSHNVRLCVVGPGAVDDLDREAVTYLGRVPNDRIWDYHYFAHVGLALAQGPVQHNESSKIYYYLRAGLPVVSESPIPNNHLIEETSLGFVAPFGDAGQMAEMVAQAAAARWPRRRAMRHMIDRHTWDHRARIYEAVFHKHPLSRAPHASAS